MAGWFTALINKVGTGNEVQPVRLSDGITLDRPFLAGLLIRFDEGNVQASVDLLNMIPGFKPPILTPPDSDGDKAAMAASGLALALAFKAMMGMRTKLPDEDEVSKLDLAIGASYAVLIFLAFDACVREDGVTMPAKPIVQEFVGLFVYLSPAVRSGAFQIALELLKGVVGSELPNVKQYQEHLSQVCRNWLWATTTDKRAATDLLADQIFPAWIGGLRATVADPLL